MEKRKKKDQFPLIGTGTTQLDAHGVAHQLIDAAISYVENNPQTKIQKIFFLAYNEDDLNLCKHIFDQSKRVIPTKA